MEYVNYIMWTPEQSKNIHLLFFNNRNFLHPSLAFLYAIKPGRPPYFQVWEDNVSQSTAPLADHKNKLESDELMEGYYVVGSLPFHIRALEW